MTKFNNLINKEELGINKELSKILFNFQMPSAMLKAIHDTDNKNENNILVDAIKSGLSHLEDEIENMSGDETEIEKLYKIIDIVEKFLSLIDKIKKDKD